LTSEEPHAALFEHLSSALQKHDLAVDTPERFVAAHEFIDELPDVIRSILGDTRQVVAANSFVHETAILGDDVVVFPGAYIGPYCFLQSSTIVFPGCRLGYLVETNVCVLFSRVQIHHAAVVCQSIIGSECNLAFGFATATRKISGGSVRYADHGGGLKSSPATHHGAVLGQDVAVGTQVAIMPGASVMPGVRIMPQRCVKGLVTEKTATRK
jgi:UDP-3-O-[3-hydroxymyristoyl] glucosamine N-acyltransferase